MRHPITLPSPRRPLLLSAVLSFLSSACLVTAQTNWFPPSGDVGIGTTTPHPATDFTTLDIRGTTGGDISLGNGSTRTGLLYSYEGETFLGSVNAAPLNFATAGVERMRIDSVGNVGIGTTNPGSYKLAVNGTIHAKEVVVDNNGWPDFVFADSYRLAPLSEVEAHIKTRKHLPGIPSAAEVAQGGVSLGDMQARLLAKIEELTLHQIALEKRLGALEQENARLRQQPQP